MRWFKRNLPWLLLALVVSTTVVLALTLVVGLFVVFGAMLSGATLVTALGGTAVVLSVVAALVAVDVLFAFALVATVVRRASLPRSDRLAALFSAVERVVPPARPLALSERFGPTFEERQREIKRRYVEGQLTEAEFEQQMRLLLDRAESDGVERDRLEESWELELARASVDRPGGDRPRTFERDADRSLERE